MEPLDIFKASGAILDGHFSLTSGRHSDRYLEKFNLLQWPEYTEKICELMDPGLLQRGRSSHTSEQRACMSEFHDANASRGRTSRQYLSSG